MILSLMMASLFSHGDGRLFESGDIHGGLLTS